MKLLNTLSIKNMTYEGIHGLLEEEQKFAQPFLISVTLATNFERAMKSDDINDTVDYITIEKIVQQIIEGESRKLIEVLAGDIADAVLLQTPVLVVSVTLAKSRPKSTGIPEITIHKFRNTL